MPNTRDVKLHRAKGLSAEDEAKAIDRLVNSGRLNKIIAKIKDVGDIKNVEQRLARTATSDIYPIPEIVNPERRNATKFDFKLFNETYLSKTFTLKWAKTHLESMSIMQEAVLRGDGQYAFADPRGSGKTSLAESLALWASLHGHRRFLLIMGATEKHSIEIFNSMLTEIEGNDLLLEDFPEVCYPFIMLTGSYFRTRFQHVSGKPTKIEWRKDFFTFPIVEGSQVSGSTIACVSITGRVRGIKRKTAEGISLRPDFLIIDDAQTDESAKSAKATENRERIILNAVKGLGGPDKLVTAVMPCTVIYANDLAERFLDNQKRPEWQGKRNKLLEKFPDNIELWQQYATLRADSFRQGLGAKLATEFYKSHRDAMDKGAVVTWIERYDKQTQLSAIQFAMDLWIDDAVSFASEYQNEPLILSNEVTGRVTLKAKYLLDRYSNYKSGTVPHDTQCITAGVDIQEKILYYLVVAWTTNFGGVIVDYGSYPKQPVSYFSTSKPLVTLESLMPELAGNLSPQVYRGLSHIQQFTMSRRFNRDNTNDWLGIDKVLIDRNWSLVSDVVDTFCRENEAKNIYVPSSGRGIGAAMLPMESWSIKPGERIGLNWRYRLSPSGKGRHVIWDTNFWKSRVAERLIAPKGVSNALLLYGDEHTDHKLLADHLSSEYSVTVFGRGRSVDQWNTYASMSENHWWDCLIQAAIAASMSGLELHEKADSSGTVPATKKQRKIVTADMYKKK